jgi:hypothetical protein
VCVIGLVLAAASASLNLASWSQGGDLDRADLVGSLGISLLLAAILVGSERRGAYYALFAGTVAMLIVRCFL